MVIFRVSTINDIPILQSLAREIWFAHYTGLLSADQIEYMLDLMYSTKTIEQEINSGVIWEEVLVDSEPAGFIAYTNMSGKLKLNKLYLKPEIHGKGIGQQALSHVIDYARKNKIKEIYLSVNKKNYKAIKAYEKAGFKYTESKVVDIGHGYVMDDFVYTYDVLE
jgi:ribosomal protein S18 acetylase RimI-like enzyme